MHENLLATDRPDGSIPQHIMIMLIKKALERKPSDLGHLTPALGKELMEASGFGSLEKDV